MITIKQMSESIRIVQNFKENLVLFLNESQKQELESIFTSFAYTSPELYSERLMGVIDFVADNFFVILKGEWVATNEEVEKLYHGMIDKLDQIK